MNRHGNMNILSFNWHTPYLSLLSALGHHFDIAPANRKNSSDKRSWHDHMRPVTSNLSLISTEEAISRLDRKDYYDLIIAHDMRDLLLTEKHSIPKIQVFHNKFLMNAEPARKKELIDSLRGLLSGVYCVFISRTKRYDWGLPGEIILPGIDVSLYKSFTGEIPRALRVGNLIKERDFMSGFSIQEAVLRDLPNLVIGGDPGIPGSRPSRDWEDLKQAYRENRVFLNTNIPRWEDGYNLAMLEAMATGMPVVSLANPLSPIRDGQNGYMAGDVPGLRRRVEALLNDVSLAREIGAEGKKTVEELFPMEPFLEKWENAIQRAYGWYPHQPKESLISSGHHHDSSVS